MSCFVSGKDMREYDRQRGMGTGIESLKVYDVSHVGRAFDRNIAAQAY